MGDLFESAAAIPGFRYAAEVITTDEERRLLEAIAEVELRPFVFRGFEAKRLVAAFGVGYSFSGGTVTGAPPIPAFLTALAERVAPLAGVPAMALSEALITHYPQGAGIGWHRDAPPFDVIVGVSLLAACPFRLRPYVAAGATMGRSRRATVTVPLAPRSAYVLAGPARAEWEHSIAEVPAPRYSVTFRTLRTRRRR